MDDKITLDRETFKALAVDTRVRILKTLDDRQHTLSDLAEEYGMAPSTIKEHLDTLVSAGLIRQIDKGMKWKYYRLTSKGKEIVNPYEKRVVFLLATSAIAALAAGYMLVSRLQELLSAPFTAPVPQMLAGSAEEAARDEGSFLLKTAANESMPVLERAVEEVAVAAPQIPYIELAAVLLSCILIGFCVGYLIKKKKLI